MKKENRMFCNQCGKEIEMHHGTPMQDVLSVRKEWGYFSKQDGTVYEFDLCEACVKRLTEQFQIPVTVTEQLELL